MARTEAGFSVAAITDCSHTHAVNAAAAHATAPPRCATCDDGSEVWVCLTCAHAGCSRHVGGHAAAHHDATGHPLALSLADLSVWCYDCLGGAYVDVFNTPALHAVFSTYYRRAFGEEPELPVVHLMER